MALINENKNYLRVLKEGSYIKDSRIFVKVRTYKTEDDRKKEAERLDLFKKVLNTISDQTISNPEDEFIDGINQWLITWQHEFYKITSSAPAPEFTEEDMTVIEYLEKNTDFKCEWITDPIKIVGVSEIYVGDYIDEEVDHSMYYNKLKEVAVDTTEDA